MFLGCLFVVMVAKWYRKAKHVIPTLNIFKLAKYLMIGSIFIFLVLKILILFISMYNVMINFISIKQLYILPLKNKKYRIASWEISRPSKIVGPLSSKNVSWTLQYIPKLCQTSLAQVLKIFNPHCKGGEATEYSFAP